ncbi:MAG: GH92 family glycosyl hydrolase [Verrucomicrobiota bacterium]|jgi:predicted alpha-1,2-mannosidase
MQKYALIFLLVVFVTNPLFGENPRPVTLANPLQGTDSRDGFSHGNTYPAIALPFPMNTWAPYTEPQDNSFYYQYRHHRILGIRQTHEPSVWIREHATFALMPVSGKLAVTEMDRASTFRHEDEIAQPSYYKVHLDTWQAVAEVTPTERAARFRFTFEQPADAYVVLDVFKSDKPVSVEIIPSENKIIGVARNNSGAVPDNYGNYFVIVFDQPFTAHGVWTDDQIQPGVTNLSGRHLGAFLKFDTSGNRVVECKVASSFVSLEQAARNLEQEIGHADFATIRHRAEETWNSALGRVQVEGGSAEQQRTFYSGLYRSILFPHRVYELDANNQPIYRSPNDGRVHSGVMYTDSGYWDTFRAAHPLYNLLYPEVSAEILQSAINSYQESGWLPAWSSPGNRQAMIGNHAFSLLADGWAKGITNFDLPTAVEAVVHDAHHGGFFGMGRGDADFYDRLGYVPYTNVLAGTARTLEYAYDDFCAALLAQAAGRPEEERSFRRSAMNYTNVFDPAAGLMRGRNEDGSWHEPFDPIEWGGPFIEGNAWQWNWSVMQDIPGLIQLMGGDAAFAKKLDTLFGMGSDVNVGTYHFMIHEMNEMVAQNLGQYAHGNEPVHHVIYLYDYAGQPWKTQARIRQVMDLLYQSTPDGLSGDEDTGQMSAWYVLSALGIYPVCPGTPVYLIGSPVFDQATLHLENGKTFTIAAENNGPQEYYIDGAKLDGEAWDKIYITHDQILQGGKLSFQMASFPNYHWAVSAESRPPSPMLNLR